MSETIGKYNEVVEKLKNTFSEFIIEAESGREGRGSRKNALQARKISVKIANDLKDFRAISVTNDKEKAKQKNS